MTTGFIGTGSMGSLLIEAFVQAGALAPAQVIASNRTAAKVQALADRYPGLRAAQHNRETASESQTLFLCVKPMEMRKVLDEIRDVLTPSQTVLTISSPVQVAHLEQELPCKIAKVVPSITNFVLSGPTLVSFGSRWSEEDKQSLFAFLRTISAPSEVPESFIRVTSDIACCGPAFFAYLLQQFVEAAVDVTGLDEQRAEALACEMLLGTGKLLTEAGFTPKELCRRVTVPGGITEIGLAAIAKEPGNAFRQLFRATHAKFEEDLHRTAGQFMPPSV
ncbi:pyrroline-5-carboxylate reductase [Paenibacillus sp. J31TS4]|uniref:late competence protein ComER n=1 Tax=Paenibacillus sp. J31TS4 TaxID=2807195 RepID=UPI001B252B94|nr:late competence protein ComER [Paenibacillus sp. J31TS4]GIP39558.1 pyrroline-5-carboxylate reductase [Paenibacillus sp. J31TS4]